MLEWMVWYILTSAGASLNEAPELQRDRALFPVGPPVGGSGVVCIGSDTD